MLHFSRVRAIPLGIVLGASWVVILGGLGGPTLGGGGWGAGGEGIPGLAGYTVYLQPHSGGLTTQLLNKCEHPSRDTMNRLQELLAAFSMLLCYCGGRVAMN